jgi:hypothetical protein
MSTYQRVLEPFRAIGVTILIIDHQSRLRGGESYQSKSAFGSVYKMNLARSVIQVEVDERGEGALALKLRQKKHKFGLLADPFGAKLKLTEEMVAVEASELDDADLAEEQTLSTEKRLELVLQKGPAYPEEIAEATGMPLKTVKPICRIAITWHSAGVGLKVSRRPSSVGTPSPGSLGRSAPRSCAGRCPPRPAGSRG